MKKIILFAVLFFVSFSVTPQSVSKDSIGKNNDVIVDKKIDSIIVKNQEDTRVIKAVSENNKERLKTLKAMDTREEVLLERLLSYFKKNKNKNLAKKELIKKEVKTVIKKVPETLYVTNNKKDSMCVETVRTFLGKRKCISWQAIND